MQLRRWSLRVWCSVDGELFAFPGFPSMLEPMLATVLAELDDAAGGRLGGALHEEQVELPVSEGVIADVVEEWAAAHPQARTASCLRALQLTTAATACANRSQLPCLPLSHVISLRFPASPFVVPPCLPCFVPLQLKVGIYPSNANFGRCVTPPPPPPDSHSTYQPSCFV